MTVDKPFMERIDWMDADGKCKYRVFCPVAPTAAWRRLRAVERQSREQAKVEAEDLSALELQYDRELHEMVGYMRRLDGEFGMTKKKMKFMDPFARDGESKWGNRWKPDRFLWVLGLRCMVQCICSCFFEDFWAGCECVR